MVQKQPRASDNWAPYDSRIEFETAEFLFKPEQMSAGNIDILFNLWAASLVKHGDHSPFMNVTDLYHAIDMTALGDVKWESFTMSYQGEQPNSEMDYGLFHEFLHGEWQLNDFMSGDWAWNQADIIMVDKKTHSAAFMPIILGSDKMTVSVATGQNEYYLIYMSTGNSHNSMRCAHRDAVVLLGFLAILKADKEYADDPLFQKYR
ncbi:uncharacterized protein LAESUDRAFT_737161 [Laetiporus sulphureus 93-53]|uniref:Uncharacterized protein n=1 Tax=Laetiporus sulphureus 93-53 TaxID=1314785 RepID=A0A165E3L9_9APHY|nr:uncharacterized protein LAESUDRAFT_737161 [Laetiporus sulphureus 93-53]KZT06186.1 hypothetical protein LAESUDRAFT_737161 [Laetiporus sulphureus 93-53]